MANTINDIYMRVNQMKVSKFGQKNKPYCVQQYVWQVISLLLKAALYMVHTAHVSNLYALN
jgi:hypothetical protein